MYCSVIIIIVYLLSACTIVSLPVVELTHLLSLREEMVTSSHLSTKHLNTPLSYYRSILTARHFLLFCSLGNIYCVLISNHMYPTCIYSTL